MNDVCPVICLENSRVFEYIRRGFLFTKRALKCDILEEAFPIIFMASYLRIFQQRLKHFVTSQGIYVKSLV